MAGLTIEFQGLAQVQKALAGAPKELAEKLDKVLEKGAREIELRANQKKPVDLGGLQVRVDSKVLSKEITVNPFYAAFIEFGTGRYAAEYVATLPEDWQTYARSFKGQAGGSGGFKEFLDKMIAWVHRQGIAGTYSVKTQRRTGNAKSQETQDKEVAYLIVRSILKNGIRPHPFLFPAFNEVKPQLEADIINLINTFALSA